jgi:hypothetical protein
MNTKGQVYTRPISKPLIVNKQRCSYPSSPCVSGLVVKSIVAIDGPRVRFAADALAFALESKILYLAVMCKQKFFAHQGLYFFWYLTAVLQGYEDCSFIANGPPRSEYAWSVRSDVTDHTALPWHLQPAFGSAAC